MSNLKRVIIALIFFGNIAGWILPISVESYSPIGWSIVREVTYRQPSWHRGSRPKLDPVTLSAHRGIDNSRKLTPLDASTRDYDGHLQTGETGILSRRRALKSLALVAAASVIMPVSPSNAGVAEYDKVTGSLYTPKAEMLSGGSAAARGTVLSTTSKTKLQPGQALQTLYNTRFISYLSRFLITFDPAARAWWIQNVGNSEDSIEISAKFAEFAESVEIGLADYFVGPYGSYGSVKAAAAGLDASRQVRSSRAKEDNWIDLRRIINRALGKTASEDRSSGSRVRIEKQGVLNLYTLLKARYTSVDMKRQLAILFSFFDEGALQPTAEIQSLLGEADNATISRIDLIRPNSNAEAKSRTSSRRGGGYSFDQPPSVVVEAPPALGSLYQPCKATPIMEPTSRVLRINVTDGGEGYTTPPEIFVRPPVGVGGNLRSCAACAILDRDGHVESILVLDPGYGYGGDLSLNTNRQASQKKNEPVAPRVAIAAPSTNGGRRATAEAEMEYEIVAVDIINGGNGYVSSEPPQVRITEPIEDPDWFVDGPQLKALLSEFGPVRGEVVEMKGPSGDLVYSMGSNLYSPQLQPPKPSFSIAQIRRNPTELLPPELRPVRNSLGEYIIASIAAVPTYTTSPNPRYRAVDPLFGAIGSVPVTKSAMELNPSEYGRLALSGAVCTVLVRTALNPLELIKTKQQLQNDEELLAFTRERVQAKIHDSVENATLAIAEPASSKKNQTVKLNPNGRSQEEEVPIGSLDLILGLVQLRGPMALFQSADITFLASLMFGSFGFGATELFRRSFSSVFFDEGAGATNSEVVLLLAATVATVITSFFAAPFELLRVRSMGLVEEKRWTEVLEDFVNEKTTTETKTRRQHKKELQVDSGDHNGFDFKNSDFRDLLPLWVGFPPTAFRELAFAIPKFLAFDLLAKQITAFFNAQAGPGSLPIQVGVGTSGLAISAIAGAVAGLAGALVSHPADLILTYTSASKKKPTDDRTEEKGADWRSVVKELLSREGGIANLFVGLPPRLVFFFLVIGLQFFLYDYVKNLLNVGSDDLSLVLDVFYAVRQGLIQSS